MRKAFSICLLTLACLAALDVCVAAGLMWAEKTNRLGSLVRYFEYGRSVPGKLDRWHANPAAPGNLLNVAWRSDILATSETQFAAETQDTPPVVRTYGMSFVNNIVLAAIELTPTITWDSHAGPSAPPNYTYSLFEDDHPNRRPGDIVVFGILSAGVPAMAALSNRTWVFEQPAPMTYPIYRPSGDGLIRIEPHITQAQDEFGGSPEKAWLDQIAQEDAFHSPVTFGLTFLDASPFFRLVRRSLAKSHIETRTTDLLQGTNYPYHSVLNRMVESFAQSARADGLRPLVMLIQTKDPRDADLLAITETTLRRHNIPYLATADIFDPRDLSGFVSDGHYKASVDRLFAQRFIEILGL